MSYSPLLGVRLTISAHRQAFEYSSRICANGLFLHVVLGSRRDCRLRFGMKVGTRRLFHLTAGLLCLGAHGVAGVPGLSLRGKLGRSVDDKPGLETSDRKPVYLECDEPTEGLVKHTRLGG